MPRKSHLYINSDTIAIKLARVCADYTDPNVVRPWHDAMPFSGKRLRRLSPHSPTQSDIPEGNIGVVAANGKSKLLVVRGPADGLKGYLLLDDVSRNELNVHESSTHHFTITPVGWWGNLKWACRAAGRPPRRLDFQRQYALKPARCQRMIVSGLTIANASQALGNSR
jgi:hypothetical protein